MTEIYLDETHRITTDEYQFILEIGRVAQKGKFAGQKVWTAEKYYPTVEFLLRGLLGAHLLKADSKSLKDIQAAINGHSKVLQALAKQFKAALEAK